MAFGAGNPGRPKGARNFKTAMVAETMARLNFDPAEALVRVYKDARKEYKRAAEIHDAICDARNRAGLGHKNPLSDEGAAYLKIATSAAAELMPYIYPKLKFTAHADMNPDQLAHSFSELARAVLDTSTKENLEITEAEILPALPEESLEDNAGIPRSNP